MKTLEARFWAKVQKTDGCWLWTGAKNPDGYGRFWRKGKLAGAHRVSWEIANGATSGDLDVLHECDNPPCVRPTHLFLGTHTENMADMIVKARAPRSAGEANGRSKLTAPQVVDLLSREGQTQLALAAEFGVSASLVRAIQTRKRWAHLKAA